MTTGLLPSLPMLTGKTDRDIQAIWDWLDKLKGGLSVGVGVGGGGVSGGGTAKQIAVWSGAAALTGYADFLWDEANSNLDLGGNSLTGASDANVIGSGNHADDAFVHIHGYVNDLDGATHAGAFGEDNTVTDTESYAFGLENTVTNSNAFAFGDNNTVESINSYVFGRENIVTGDDSYAVGDTNIVTNGASSAHGRFLDNNGWGSVHLFGANVKADRAFAVFLGVADDPLMGLIVNEGIVTMPGVIVASPTANGQSANFKVLTEETTILAAATTDTAIQAPINSLVLGVTVRVTAAIPTATTFDVGVAGATTRYGTGISTAAATTNVSPGTTSPSVYNAGTAIRMTPNLTPGAATGKVRVTIHYLDLTPPDA
jgi:hypothetical protein